MAHPASHNHSALQFEDADRSLQAAEHRAEEAEERVQQLELRIEALENAPGAVATKPANSATNSSAMSEPDSATADSGGETTDAICALRQESMMDHLLNALQDGKDIGHYGRLVFAMVAHHFLSDEVMIEWLTKDPDFSADDANALLRQVESRDYNPPRRDRILEWQSQQEFPILPNPEDPDCGNVYRNLKFPPSVYEHIQGYQEEKARAQDPAQLTDASR